MDELERLTSHLSGRYAIEREVGSGGMATVYLARDLRHNRRVALKVLRPELGAVLGQERFLAEIEVTANLQHPHLLPLFDSGEADGLLFYVMPYVEGESLRARLERERQLPVDEAVRIGVAVASALDYAHQRGVVHRDLKPENVLLHAGQPVVADFGIALAVSNAGGGRITQTGISLGTPQYMSPEQATGDQPIDGRTDVYSLGAVLYEMLAGEPPHTARTAQAVMARLLTEVPRSVRATRPSVPAHVDAAVARALEKLPADRFSSARELGEALQGRHFAAVATATDAIAAPGGATRRWVRRWGAGAVWLGVGALAAYAVLTLGPGPGGSGRPLDSDPLARLVLALPEDQLLAPASARARPLDISRDGTLLVYRVWSARGTELVLRPLGSFESRPLAGSDGAVQPFFSPDGRWVGFFAGGRLQKVPVAGGAPFTVAEGIDLPWGADWGADDTILFATQGGGLFRVSASGGRPERILPPVLPDDVPGQGAPGSPRLPQWPRFLPGGRHALVGTDEEIYLLAIETGELRALLPGSEARYLPTGHLLYHEGNERLRTVPFDLARLEVTGPARPAVENVFRGPASGAVVFAVSETGSLVYVVGGFERTLVLVDRNGRETPIGVEPRGYRFPAVSPDGRHLAITVDPRPPDIWIVDLERETASRLTTDDYNLMPAWAPDGSLLAFARGADQYVVDWPEPAAPRLVAARPLAQYAPSFTHDSRILALETQVETGRDLVWLSLEDGTSGPFLVTNANEQYPAISPDGRWVAYVSDVSGADEVYVTPYARPSAARMVSVGGGSDPVWSKDGRELFYRRGNVIMAVETSGSDGPGTGSPKELFAGPYDFTQPKNWDVTPDGRFLMVRGDPTTLREIRVVLNWFTEVQGESRDR